MPRMCLWLVLPLCLCVRGAAAAEGPEAEAAEVRDLLSRWVKAYNTRDFATYESLYAPRFQAVLRPKGQLLHQDRLAWMQDRRQIFKLRPQLSLDEPRIVIGAGGVSVWVRQRFQAGKFVDNGEHQLDLAREGGAGEGEAQGPLRIVREVALEDPPAAPLPVEQFTFVVHGAVVLHRQPPAAWAQGPLQIVTLKDVAVVRRQVNPAALPEAVRKWRGQRFRLFSSAGPVCEATVAGFALIGRTGGFLDSLEAWQRLQPAVAAQQVWELSLADHGVQLVGELEGEQGPCGKATWARSAELPVPALARAEPPPKQLGDAVLRAGGRLAGSVMKKQHQRSWAQVLRAGATTLATFNRAAGEGCLASQDWALFGVAGKGGLKLLAREIDIEPQVAVDLDGDGVPELLYESGDTERHRVQVLLHRTRAPTRPRGKTVDKYQIIDRLEVHGQGSVC